MAQAFILTGTTPVITAKYSPPIILDENKRYGLALFGFQYFNAIENIIDGCDTFYYSDRSIKIPHGAYEVTDLHDYISGVLKERHPNHHKGSEELFSLSSNNTTLKCEIRCAFDIDFSKPNSIGALLGFSNKSLTKNIIHISDKVVEILKVYCIRISCPLIRGSFLGSVPSQILGTVFIKTPPGYLISYLPENVTYFEIATSLIDEISISLLDQENRLVNLNNETAHIHLVLKEI